MFFKKNETCCICIGILDKISEYDIMSRDISE